MTWPDRFAQLVAERGWTLVAASYDPAYGWLLSIENASGEGREIEAWSTVEVERKVGSLPLVS